MRVYGDFGVYCQLGCVDAGSHSITGVAGKKDLLSTLYFINFLVEKK